MITKKTFIDGFKTSNGKIVSVFHYYHAKNKSDIHLSTKDLLIVLLHEVVDDDECNINRYDLSRIRYIGFKTFCSRDEGDDLVSIAKQWVEEYSLSF